MALSIAPIGSCRIHDPLRRARVPFGFHVNRGRSMGFTHSSPEAVQQLKFMRGEIDIPEPLWTSVSNVDREDVLAQKHDDSDIYVIELSSEKILSAGDTYLQLNYLRTQFPDFFSDNTRKNAYWKAIEKQTDEEVDAFLAEAWSGTPEKDADSAFLRQVRLRRADVDQTRRDIQYLRDTLPHVLFVTHVNAVDSKTGAKIKTRDRYIAMVKEVAEQEGCAVFDPTESMEELGQGETLEPDLNHFTDMFKERVVQDWFAYALQEKLDAVVREKQKTDQAESVLKAHVVARILHGSREEADQARSWFAGLVAEFPKLKRLQETISAYN